MRPLKLSGFLITKSEYTKMEITAERRFFIVDAVTTLNNWELAINQKIGLRRRKMFTSDYYRLLMKLSPEDGATGGGGAEEGGGEKDPPVKTYTESEVDKLIARKIAESQKKYDKKLKEALEAEARARLPEDEQQKAELERLTQTVADYERQARVSANVKSALELLKENNVAASSELVESLVTEDETKSTEAVKAFVKLYKEDLNNDVKDVIKGKTPVKSSGEPVLKNKEDIWKIEDMAERRKAMLENMELFGIKGD